MLTAATSSDSQQLRGCVIFQEVLGSKCVMAADLETLLPESRSLQTPHRCRLEGRGRATLVDKQLLRSKATLLASGLLALRLHTNAVITAGAAGH